MKRFILLALLAASSPFVRADSEESGAPVFLSLTRKAETSDRLPIQTSVITSDELRRSGARNVGEALEGSPSTQIRSYGALGGLEMVQVRGSSTDQVLVLMDGRPLNGAFGLPDLSLIPLESVERIEIVRGGSSAVFGANALGGVINVITKRPVVSVPLLEAKAETGSFATHSADAALSGGSGPSSGIIGASRVKTDGFRDNSAYDATTLQSTLSRDFKSGGRVDLQGGLTEAHLGVPGFLALDPSLFDGKKERAATSPHNLQETETDFVRLRHTLALGDLGRTSLQAYASGKSLVNTDPDSAVDTLRDEWTQGLEGEWDGPKGFSLGGGTQGDRVDNRDHLNAANGYSHGIAGWNVFAQSTVEADKWTVVSNLRSDRSSRFNGGISPRLLVVHSPNSGVKLSAGVSRSFRAPTLDDLFGQYHDNYFSYSGNPNLKPERAWTYEAGAQKTAGPIVLSANLFRAEVTDLIQTKPVTFDTEVNIGRVIRQGVETEVRREVGPWRQSINYTYLLNEGATDGESTLRTLSYSPRHSGRLTLEGPLPFAFAFSTTARFTSRCFAGNGETGTRLPSYWVWDARLSKRIHEAELYFRLENIADRRYVELNGYPLPGRTFWGGLSIRFFR